MNHNYTLDENFIPHGPVSWEEYFAWHKAFDFPKKTELGLQHWKTDCGDACVSTIYLGSDHSYVGPPPVLWETMIFGGDNDGDIERYSSYESARQGHLAWCKKLEGIGERPTDLEASDE